MSPSPQTRPTYSTEAVQQILQKAMTYRDRSQFTDAQLLEMASELGVSDQVLQQATQDWQLESEQQQVEAVAKRDRRHRFRSEVITYAGVNTLLIVINLATAGAITWAIYPLLGWGIGLCFGPCQSNQKHSLQR
ncbi:MAG: 2TM domain-containing protein [Cyanobacteria bacterium J06659_2]